MSTKQKRARLALAALAGLVAGCVAPIPVKDMLNDRQKFLTTQFAPNRLPTQVRQTVEKAGTPAVAFKELHLGFNADQEEDDKKKQLEGKALLLDAGNGLVQTQLEWSRNGFPYRINNSLEYVGIVPLLWNSGFHDEQNTFVTWETKEARRLDRVTTLRQGDELVFDFSYGGFLQSVNLPQERITCKVGATRPANGIHANFSGTAVALECNALDANKTPVSRTDWAYLSDYGVAIRTALKTRKETLTFQYTSVKVVRK